MLICKQHLGLRALEAPADHTPSKALQDRSQGHLDLGSRCVEMEVEQGEGALLENLRQAPHSPLRNSTFTESVGCWGSKV